ncbi:hypothetical protein TREMEDRAFT_33397 [Tremella mesenterica DSM 1558]|uniref:uncharacterized protein n=1 Tax=Tremella mesenterica (strain ATCC 24925 / CBS 8224 / DSM 1558 / NBRC 9311 / NRRL Y-6157 / RJB 2259-6 / UBC 559-6) TaxID=578456 RepID=UPI0003F49475|nr:uncharacterized protein TREMEDRAFT_33397 [Tremella mesenterica DSM 1558]EIW67496.1 hypothetical protein TREMEDRAFT_33397 [Tremella mesenterica DSM 1558]
MFLPRHSHRLPIPIPITIYSRTFFSLFRRSPLPSPPSPPPSTLFHLLSQSPSSALREKADRVKAHSLCPVSYERYGERIRPKFDCPNCGWPTHASEQRWNEGRSEHERYCGRLREVNEDEHDLRSGRKMKEFESMPEWQPYEAAINFSSWDTFFFSRNFPSIDNDRAIRHVSKILTYPITVGAILHQNGPFTSGNGRITREGQRSMAAFHSILHLPRGAITETSPSSSSTPQPPFRIFLLGARAESTLPPDLWSQLTFLFPRSSLHIYFIGPEVGLPLLSQNSPRRKTNYDFDPDGGYGVPSYTLNVNPQLKLTSLRTNYEEVHNQFGPFDPYSDVFFAFSPGLGFPHQPSPQPVVEENNTSSETAGIYSTPESEPVPPSPQSTEIDQPLQPLVQAQTTWKRPLQQILGTKCALFFTAFSPLDLQRDVSALLGTTPPSALSGPREYPDHVALPTRPIDRIDKVTDEFEMVLTPGINPFGSIKWEIAEWDVRVGVKTNWGVWGIRGKRYEVVEGEE